MVASLGNSETLGRTTAEGLTRTVWQTCGAKECRSPRSFLVVVIILIVVIDRAEEMGEHLLSHVASLLPGLHVRKADVDSL